MGVSGILVGGIVAAWMTFRLVRHSKARGRFAARRREWLQKRMQHMLRKMPEDSPPRLIVSTLPRLLEQNEQILALLQEQNALIAGRAGSPVARRSPGRGPQ